MSYRSGLQMFAIMTNWKTEFHKPLTRPGVKHDEEMSICSSTPQAHMGYINSSLLESDLKMSESHANVVSFDENVSTLSNLYERNEHLLMNETTVENMTTIGTVYESMMRNQRTYLANQDNKHRLKDECTDFSLILAGMESEKYRNDQEVSQSFLVNMEAPDVTENHRNYNVRKSLKCSKRASQVENVLSVILCTIHHIRLL